jgi:hypothetical protein
MDKFSKGIKNFFKGFWHLLSNNLGLKIASVLFAIILWGFVMTEINPPREKDFNDIDLRFENINSLSEKELTVKGSLDEILNKVEITIEANPDYLYLVTEENIKAYVDLSVINKPGEQTVAIKATSSIGTVVGIKPKTVTLNVEDYITRVVPVTYEIKNTPGEDFYVSDPVFTPEFIEIKGARSLVEQVATGVCYIDLHEVTKDVKESIPLVLRDEEGEILEAKDYSEDLPSVIVDIKVMPQKEVPISIEGAVIGLDSVAEGFIVTDYYVEPTTVLVAAEQSILDTILEVQIEGIDISGAKTDLSIQTNVRQIEGTIIKLEPTGIKVNVEINALESTQIFESVEVELLNLADGLSATVVPKSIKVIITDEELLLIELKSSDIKLYIDLDGKKAGDYTLPIMIEPLNGIETTSVTFNIEKANISITEN